MTVQSAELGRRAAAKAPVERNAPAVVFTDAPEGQRAQGGGARAGAIPGYAPHCGCRWELGHRTPARQVSAVRLPHRHPARRASEDLGSRSRV
jgi:hypothetical protein